MVPRFGPSGPAPRALPALTWLGLTCAGVGVAVRVLRPGELVARWLVVAGAALFLIGALGTVVGVLVGVWAVGGRELFGDVSAPLAGMFAAPAAPEAIRRS